MFVIVFVLRFIDLLEFLEDLIDFCSNGGSGDS